MTSAAGQLLNYHIMREWWSIDGAYENRIGIRQPPYFGTEPRCARSDAGG
jgi:hypothetical protein